MSELIICWKDFCVEVAVCSFECSIKSVRHRLIWSEDTEVLVVFVELKNIADIVSELFHILCFYAARSFNFESIFFEVRCAEVLKKVTTVCMWVSRNSVFTLWSDSLDFSLEAVVLIKEFFRLVRLEPCFEFLHVFCFIWIWLCKVDRYLVCTE